MAVVTVSRRVPVSLPAKVAPNADFVHMNHHWWRRSRRLQITQFGAPLQQRVEL
jgi:hypothetical protein